MASTTTASAIARVGALLADPTRAEMLCAMMDGRAHTGSELARHVGVAPSTVSEHLSKLLDAGMVAVTAQGRHRYWRLSSTEIAELLETLGISPASPTLPKAPAQLTYARTCYDHLAGELAVAIYDQLLAFGHLTETDEHLRLEPSGYELLASIGVDIDIITATRGRPRARPCLDWTQRRHHLAGTAGKELLNALSANNWVRPGKRPRSIHVTSTGRTEISRHFHLT